MDKPNVYHFNGGNCFRLRRGQNMAGQKTLWLDLNGSSYTPAAFNSRDATAFAKQLRRAADWIDENKAAMFKKESK